MKRPCIEVSTLDSTKWSGDPVERFVSKIQDTSAEAQKDNCQLLKNLINNGHIVNSSIIWENNHISKIYGVRIDRDGRIRYADKTAHHLEDRPVKASIPISPLDLSSLKAAVIRENNGSDKGGHWPSPNHASDPERLGPYFLQG